MATITPTLTYLDDRRLLVEWNGMASGDDGDWVEVSQYDVLTIQPNTGFIWQGSNRLDLTPEGLATGTSLDGVLNTGHRYVRPVFTTSSTPDAVLFAVKRG